MMTAAVRMKPSRYELHCFIPQDLGEWLVNEANAQGVTLTALVVEALSSWRAWNRAPRNAKSK